MHRLPVLLTLICACGDATGLGELALREGARYRLSYTAVVRYDCAARDTSGAFIPIPFPPPDTTVCETATDTVLARHDTVTAELHLTGRPTRGSFFPGAAEFEGEADGRYRRCPADGAAACSDLTVGGRSLLARAMVSCHAGHPVGTPVQREAYLGLPADVGPACRRTGADSIGVTWLSVGSPLIGVAFFGVGAEVAGRVEGLYGVWIGATAAESGRGGLPSATLGLDPRELRAESWVLEPL